MALFETPKKFQTFSEKLIILFHVKIVKKFFNKIPRWLRKLLGYEGEDRLDHGWRISGTNLRNLLRIFLPLLKTNLTNFLLALPDLAICGKFGYFSCKKDKYNYEVV